MIDTTKLKGLYAAGLNDNIQGYLENNPEEYPDGLSVFFSQWGDDFEKHRDLLFIGKSPNRWRVPYTQETQAEAFFDDKCKHEPNQIHWVEIVKPGYNPNKSHFWQVIKKVTKAYYPEAKGDWYKKIAWSDLYKVSPHSGGNPNKALRDAQRKQCVEILKEEIAILQPKTIIFLTSGWENYFLKEMLPEYNKGDMESTEWDKKKKHTTYCGEFDKRKYIVSHHPQGKKWDPHAEAILDFIR